MKSSKKRELKDFHAQFGNPCIRLELLKTHRKCVSGKKTLRICFIILCTKVNLSLNTVFQPTCPSALVLLLKILQAIKGRNSSQNIWNSVINHSQKAHLAAVSCAEYFPSFRNKPWWLGQRSYLLKVTRTP